MAAAYLVARDRTVLASRDGKDHTDTMVIYADSATQAKEMASAVYEGGDASWSAATVTEIAAPSVTSLVGWQYFIGIYDDVEDDIEVTYTAIADDDIDDVGAALVLLLNAHADIAGAAYAAMTNTLTIAETTDAMGDRAVIVRVAPPGKVIKRSFLPSLVGAITDEGMAADALSVVFTSAAYPGLYAKLTNNT